MLCSILDYITREPVIITQFVNEYGEVDTLMPKCVMCVLFDEVADVKSSTSEMFHPLAGWSL